MPQAAKNEIAPLTLAIPTRRGVPTINDERALLSARSRAPERAGSGCDA